MVAKKQNNYAVIPAKCSLWRQAQPDPASCLKLIKDYTDNFETDADHSSRRLMKCRDCDQLYLVEMLEFIDDKGNDPTYRTYVPVKSTTDADKMASVSQFEIMNQLPQIRRDWPEDAPEPLSYWVKQEESSEE